MPLRPYQQNALDAVIEHITDGYDPALVEAATGAGKSHIIAELAEFIHKLTGGNVLCLAPNADLVKQNREKFLATGNPASIFSSSAGAKCLKHPVVFATPGTVKNSIRKFGKQFRMIIIDEATGITKTVRHIIDKIQEQNPKCRVVGFDAAPYRLGEGYIYRINPDGSPVDEDTIKEPYFVKKVYEIKAHELIEAGYLTPPLVKDINVDTYDVSNLQPNARNTAAAIDQAFVGHGRKTAAIVADVVNQCKDRKGVMIFAATIRHAEEVMASLPKGKARLVTGKTPKKERSDIIAAFKRQEFKYLVNVSVFTKGFDAPHVDAIALLRFTESANLLQQIIGRGTRLYEGKDNFWILDYAENIDTHFPEGDVFNPDVKAVKGGEDHGLVPAKCSKCNVVNQFSARKNKEGLGYDEEGYFIDLEGHRIMTDIGPIPGHYGRRCMGHSLIEGHFLQCSHRWTSKKCPECAEDNDIAAKYCRTCRAEIIDPNERLVADFKRYKRDATNLQTDNLECFNVYPTMSKNGNECLRVDFTTEYRKFSIWLMPTSRSQKKRVEYQRFMDNKDNMKTVTYMKSPHNGFYDVFDYNQPVDEV